MNFKIAYLEFRKNEKFDFADCQIIYSVKNSKTLCTVGVFIYKEATGIIFEERTPNLTLEMFKLIVKGFEHIESLYVKNEIIIIP